MAEAFRCGEKETQIVAARGIGKLNSQQKQKLCENGVCSLLVEMLDNQDYESIEVALFALLSLACGSDRNKVCIEKSGAIPAILKILRCQNIALMEISLTALLVLSTCSANKLRIASSGAIQLILQFLDSRFTTVCISTRAKLDIISTLHNLSTCPQMISTILACGGLNTLNQLIYESEKSSDLVEKATGFLETIVFRSKVALNQVGESGVVIPMLVEAVEDGSAACREYAVGILLLICQSCRERYRGMILNEGAMAGMMQLSVNGTRIAREKAKELISLLRDRDSGRSSSSMSMDMRTKSEALEELMRQIDEEESGGIQMVEEMIAKLRT